MPITFSFGDGPPRASRAVQRRAPYRRHAAAVAELQRRAASPRSAIAAQRRGTDIKVGQRLEPPFGFTDPEFLRTLYSKVRNMERDLERVRNIVMGAMMLPIESSRGKIQAKIRPASEHLRQLGKTATKADRYLSLFLAQRSG